MSEEIAVIGCGQFGSVVASHCARAGHAVRLWGRNDQEVDGLLQSRRSTRVNGLVIPDSVVITTDGNAAMSGVRMIITAIPSQYARSVWKVLRPACPAGVTVVSLAKGFEVETLKRPSEVLRELEIGGEVVTLSGPSVASEVALGLPTALVVAGEAAAARQVQQALATSAWRIYLSADQIGVEAAGALKNVIALAAGMVDGMQLGINAKATLLARGTAEMARLGMALGGSRETFFGVAGVGDLATTCFSEDGRNRTLGERLGRGEDFASALRSMHSVVEGVDTCRAVVELSRRLGVEVPIASAVHAVLFGGATPHHALQELMRRASGEERL
ncbi:MAG: NAD(P)H-dependent glycerol-3-phosphate dehydrogenase [Planctomycetota bacterium]